MAIAGHRACAFASAETLPAGTSCLKAIQTLRHDVETLATVFRTPSDTSTLLPIAARIEDEVE